MASIGKMRHRVELQYRDIVRDDAGGAVGTWVTSATTWANIVPKSSTERFKGDQNENPTTYQMILRYRTDIDIGWRVKFGTRYFNVTGVLNELEADRFTTVNMTEGVAV